MKILKCNNHEFFQIKNGLQLYKIFDKDYKLEFLEDCVLESDDGEKLDIQITSIKEYVNFDSILSTINLEKFGDYSSKDEFESHIKENYNLNSKLFVCRIKNKNKQLFDIKDAELRRMIKDTDFKENNIGLSGCRVYTVKTKNDNKAILKIQNIKGMDTLEEEYNVLKYLQEKINVAKVFYYNKYDGTEYLLRQCIEGEPLYKFKNFGFKLGTELKKFHCFYDNKCCFNKFCTQNLLNNALKNIDIIYETRIKKFENYSKEELIKFLIENKPEDDALIHGDFSLTNILNSNDTYYYIDLGNVSISTKYFDIYVLKKSLKINNLTNEFDDFIKGYGIEDLDEKYLDWMSLIEASYN